MSMMLLAQRLAGDAYVVRAPLELSGNVCDSWAQVCERANDCRAYRVDVLFPDGRSLSYYPTEREPLDALPPPDSVSSAHAYPIVGAQ